MVHGNKNDNILYLKGVQGIGKSTLTEMLKDFIILLEMIFWKQDSDL